MGLDLLDVPFRDGGEGWGDGLLGPQLHWMGIGDAIIYLLLAWTRHHPAGGVGASSSEPGAVPQVVSLLANILSRRFEFQADAFAVGLGRAAPLRKALMKLDQSNKSACNVDPWYSTYHYSHPPLVERLKAIDVAEKKDS